MDMLAPPSPITPPKICSQGLSTVSPIFGPSCVVTFTGPLCAEPEPPPRPAAKDLRCSCKWPGFISWSLVIGPLGIPEYFLETVDESSALQPVSCRRQEGLNEIWQTCGSGQKIFLLHLSTVQAACCACTHFCLLLFFWGGGGGGEGGCKQQRVHWHSCLVWACIWLGALLHLLFYTQSAIWTRLESKFDVIITLNTSFICDTSDDNSVFLICYTFRWQFYVPDSRWGTMKCKQYSALTTELIDLSQAQFAAILGQLYVPHSRWGTMKCEQYLALTTELINLSQAQFAAILGQLYVPHSRWGTMKCEQYSALTTELINLSQAQFAAILGQPSVNTVSCAWPKFSLV